jgi:hypothetical protein
MENPVRDIEEDPDNPNALYIATDYGVFVSIDQGANWINMSDDAPDVLIMDLDIQKRERDLAIATYGRGFYIADIYPFKEMKPEIFEKEQHLFEIQRAVKWNMLERRGPSYGEFAKVNNPPTRAAVYYFLKQDVKSSKLLVKDLAGELLFELRGSKKAGLHRAFWNLRKRVQQTEGSRRPRQGGLVDSGLYKVTLVVDDEEIATKDLRVIQDPILN